jgi:hypothetical protein
MIVRHVFFHKKQGDTIMKIKLLVLFLLLASSSQVISGEDPSYYAGYFNALTATSVAEQVSLYNQENGYWNDDAILNVELRRLLQEVDLIDPQDEENGYWY